MRLCIDASNLRQGGGVTHLVELLANADAPAYGFDRVFLWSSPATLAKVNDQPWLVKRTDPVLLSNPLRRALWQRRIGSLARADGCDLLFAPGGTFTTPFRPIVTMCRNMLPFEWREMLRYGVSLQAMRFWALRFAQSRSFRRATGTIFLTRYAHDAVMGVIGGVDGAVEIIPHGIDARFFVPLVRPAKLTLAEQTSFEIVYVSTIDHYKHQAAAAEAVARLAAAGHPVRLTLIGPAYPPALRRLRAVMRKFDPQGDVVQYLGAIAHAEIHAAYARADIGLFASSCENMPNILLEEMAAGLPIACSDRGPMPEILRDAGVFFDPASVPSISRAILELTASPDRRAELAGAAQQLARHYSWRRCAQETFEFLARLADVSAAPADARGGSKMSSSNDMFDQRILLITGGTGSFGNAVLRRFRASGIKEIRIFSRDEKKQDDMRKRYQDARLKFYLGDVRDPNSVASAMRGVSYCFHAAALKQVPSCEFHPMEAVRTNILGTETVLEAAIAAGVERVVCLSTDKAVYPINAMGISKAMMEKVMVAISRNLEKTATVICATRYGNVMASRGSVIPLFAEQVLAGKPITVTDPAMTRFMMTLDDAVELVLYAFKQGANGDIFVQKAPAATVGTLARALLDVLDRPSHEIREIGTRHGEKLYESLISREELASAEDLGAYYRLPPDGRDLNYEKFFEQGEMRSAPAQEYNSHNTERLDLEAMKALLLKLEFIQKIIRGHAATAED